MTKLTVRINQNGSISYIWEPTAPIPDQTTFEVLAALIRKYEEDVKEYAGNHDIHRS